MSDLFYKAFEDRYRGSREIIAGRLRAYLPFLEPLAALYAPARALDIGCGRGEWLEVAGAAGFEAFGVDIDDGMLAACRERGLAVRTADGLQTLRAMADASLAMVSAFHVVEHIAFDDVRALIAEALRVLQPGGLLILETPNPENIGVGANSFYRDPSHLRPLPPELLSFAAEHAGYARQLVVRLQEPPELHGNVPIGVRHVLEGVSPDYAVVAQKAAPPGLMKGFDAVFGKTYGLSLGQLSHRYDDQAARQRGALDTAGSHALQALDQLAAVRVSVVGLSVHVMQNHQDISDAAARLDARMARADELQREFNAVLASRSWRITAPLRDASLKAQRLRAALHEAVRSGTVGASLKARVKNAARALGRAVLRNPDAKRAARAVLSRMPSLRARLREMMVQAPVAPGAPPPANQQLADLSPRAQRLYAGLKQAQQTLEKEAN
ncbi:class I SAM-dependent methyltransferase [Massilia psychrophila]|uniref:Methyltransferase type 11 n=1 Tax=Massilia psychrophila TaxID=1603353 RepID=A0A2G8T326_9BURK|nr:class I SAM-dependent methyltransferase [Massilia psychrophila]PIL40456.1 methyltransferase type 11 [Massilia psychrophila]